MVLNYLSEACLCSCCQPLAFTVDKIAAAVEHSHKT